MQITEVITSVDLKLKNGSTVHIFCDTSALYYPDEYKYLEEIEVTSSTDICFFICVGPNIENFESKWQKEIILPMFLFYKGKMTFDDFLEKLREINRGIDSDVDDTVWEIIDQLECISEDDYDSDEDLITWCKNIISDILEEPLLNMEAVKEVQVPNKPISASDIEYIFWKSYDYCQIRYIDWCSQEDSDEFRSDSHTEPGTPHFKYLLAKWTDYKKRWAPASNLYNFYGCADECSVEEAICSGDIDKLAPEWWYNERLDKFYINHNKPLETDIHESPKSNTILSELNDKKSENEEQFRELIQSNTFLNSLMESAYIQDRFFNEEFTVLRDILQYAVNHKIHINTDQCECHDIYALLKKYIDKNDSEMIRLLIDILDIPDEFMDFWHVGLLHDAISSNSAETTAILINSVKLRFTDKELEYLIDFAIESKKPEHTACLLNHKEHIDAD